jgi:hypothetical protein
VPAVSDARTNVTTLLKGMLEADGYDAIVREWPDDDNGPATIEIVARAEACGDCLVPKDVMRMVLANELPPGVRLVELRYPGEAA